MYSLDTRKLTMSYVMFSFITCTREIILKPQERGFGEYRFLIKACIPYVALICTNTQGDITYWLSITKMVSNAGKLQQIDFNILNFICLYLYMSVYYLNAEGQTWY